MTRLLTRTCAAAALSASFFTAACAAFKPCVQNCSAPEPARFAPDPRAVPTVVALQPTAPWIDSGVMVHKGDLLLVSATGEVFWQGRNEKADADGIGGMPGWKVGAGGLRAKIGSDGKIFDVGSRTSLFPDNHARPPHHPFPPPPITVPNDGALYLGFKSFVPGRNTGSLEVTIRPAVRIAPQPTAPGV